MSQHVQDHCGLPKVTRHWKRLGCGAVFMCSCGKIFRLTTIGSFDGIDWVWVEKGSA
jgi:hypothetical protein